MEEAIIINLPKIEDPRGNLSVVENDTIPFPIRRVYYLYDVPSGTQRGGHAHKEQEAFIIAVSGSFDVILNDGKEEHIFRLNMPNQGLHVPKMKWRELKNFSSGAVCLVISPAEYDEDDYIRDFDEFLKYQK